MPPDVVTVTVCEEKSKGLVAVCKERHKGLEADISCIETKLKLKADQKEMDELKTTVKDKADKDAIKTLRALQIATFLAILGQFLYVIFHR